MKNKPRLSREAARAKLKEPLPVGVREIFEWAKANRDLKYCPPAPKGTAAKVAASDLPGFVGLIRLAAAANDKQFFIDLGKCLDGKINAQWFNKLHADVADVLNSGGGLKEMRKRGYDEQKLSAGYWRKLKHDHKQAAKETLRAWRKKD